MKPVSAGSVTGTLDGPAKLTGAEPVTSNICEGTPGVATLASGMPAGMTSGSPGRAAVLVTATFPVAAIPGPGW